MALSSKINSISENLKFVRQRIEIAFSKLKEHYPDAKSPKLIAVSKTKSVEQIQDAYDCGQREFGENYIQELIEKANNDLLLKKCQEIKWHFIGHLQSNKVVKLKNIPNLSCIQTIDSIKLASSVNKIVEQDKNLDVFIQVNTSNEINKSGIDTNNLVELTKYIINECSKLNFIGLMTIGSIKNSLNKEKNCDFETLVDCRNQLVNKLNLNINQIELSMGMSNDFENAIETGSTCVRVGSSIFGERIYDNN